MARQLTEANSKVLEPQGQLEPSEGPMDGQQCGQFVVLDAWRDMFIIGPGHGVVFVEPNDKADEHHACTYLKEHYSLGV